MNITASLAREVGVRAACSSLDVSRAGFYRWQHPQEKEPSCRLSPLALSFAERSEVLDLLHTDRFVDKAPREIYAALLDEKSYFCSVRTMYRILEKEGELKERRRQVHRPRYTKPEILAKAPNEAWSWDITKLKGPALEVNLKVYQFGRMKSVPPLCSFPCTTSCARPLHLLGFV